MRELILGGQKSGKSRTAEMRAQTWLTQSQRQAVLLATALPLDQEMCERIARHQRERAARVPALRSMEPTADLAQALVQYSSPQTLVIIDCLTLWLTQRLLPLNANPATDTAAQIESLIHAVHHSAGPVVLVSNEISLGVIALDSATRRFVDALGQLHQRVAAVCDAVTLMVAGCALPVKAPAALNARDNQ